MKIIVGGAGSVGKSVAYLSRGNNDVAVVDEDERKLNEVAREWDVMPVLGSVAHPDVLQKAEAGKSDLLIAATESDEVNMIACQAAYSLFNVPRKVARISAGCIIRRPGAACSATTTFRWIWRFPPNMKLPALSNGCFSFRAFPEFVRLPAKS